MNKPRAFLAGGLGALALLAGGVSPAMAAPGDTVTTFTLGAGTLAVAVQPTAALTDGDAGAVLVSGNLGPVTVTDSRGNILGWVASAKTTTFVSNTTPSTTSVAVAYSAGTITTTGIVVTTSSGVVPLTALPLPVVLGTVALGNNTASWNPALTVALPPTSLAGLYTGTVTTSVA